MKTYLLEAREILYQNFSNLLMIRIPLSPCVCAWRQEFYCLHFGAVCRALPASAVSYEEIDGETMKRNVLFCYDLELPPDFQPQNKGYFLA
jgi:hypothetical protein